MYFKPCFVRRFCSVMKQKRRNCCRAKFPQCCQLIFQKIKNLNDAGPLLVHLKECGLPRINEKLELVKKNWIYLATLNFLTNAFYIALQSFESLRTNIFKSEKTRFSTKRIQRKKKRLKSCHSAIFGKLFRQLSFWLHFLGKFVLFDSVLFYE